MNSYVCKNISAYVCVCTCFVSLYESTIYIYIYVYICVCEREGGREGGSVLDMI